MLLLGYLVRVHGLKGEFLFHELMDEPKKIIKKSDLVLTPPGVNLEDIESPSDAVESVRIRSFRIHKGRVCLSFDKIKDRTAAEKYHNWALWTSSSLPILTSGDFYRHDWIGCDVYVDDIRIGRVIRLDPTPMEYDMVVIQDLRAAHSVNIEIPYIKSWFQISLVERCIYLKPPLGILDLNI
jgi:16S rRNA processing protein RimM